MSTPFLVSDLIVVAPLDRPVVVRLTAEQGIAGPLGASSVAELNDVVPSIKAVLTSPDLTSARAALGAASPLDVIAAALIFG